MKKFYYNRELSQDESLNVLPLEHSNTMDINSENRRGMSARAASVNSLDLMSESSTIPRVQIRDVTRSMSDVVDRTQSNAQKLVTETELSSSWLYKTMQASINARFKSPRKSPSVHKDDFEQSILQDPELKPISIKSKSAKTSSCICHFATMIAISLCSVGFLASIAAIVYMEIFADRNITSLHTTEAEVDLSDVVLDSLEANLTTHNIEGEEHILNEALTHKFDGDEDILNEILKASSTNDLPHLSNKNKTHGQFSDYVTDSGKSDLSEIKDFNVTNTNIKFQDDTTVIYEMKSEKSSKNVDSNFINKFQGRSFGIGIYQTDEEDDLPTENALINNLKQKLEVNLESDNNTLNDSVLLNTENMSSESRDILNENMLIDNVKESVSEDEFKLNAISRNVTSLENESSTQSFQSATISPGKQITSENIQLQSIEVEKSLDSDTNVLLGKDLTNISNKLGNYNNELQEPKDSDVVSTNLSESQEIKLEDSLPILKMDDSFVKDEYDVNTMLVTIDDTEVSTDSFLSNRNGEIKAFQVSSAMPSVDPTKQSNNVFSPLPKKPVDIKVSLAEAMKHLQNLDVNNKLMTSRTKPKQKVNVQKPKRKSTSNSDEERKRYLQRMRLMLYKQMQ